MLAKYLEHTQQRAEQGIPPLPLNAEQVTELVTLLQQPESINQAETLLDLLTQRVPPGVDESARVKAGFLATIATGETTSPLLSSERAIELLGTMLGGYNIQPLIELLAVSYTHLTLPTTPYV